jgi:hypothetical protein
MRAIAYISILAAFAVIGCSKSGGYITAPVTFFALTADTTTATAVNPFDSRDVQRVTFTRGRVRTLILRVQTPYQFEFITARPDRTDTIRATITTTKEEFIQWP